MSTIDVANLTDAESTTTNSGNASDVLNNTTTLDTKYITNGSAKAWVFGNSAAAIQSSLNISSSTDHGTGDYSYSVANSFDNINTIAVVATVRTISNVARIAQANSERATISIIAIVTKTDSATAADQANCAMAMGDLA